MPPDIITEDGDKLVTEDGDQIVTEDTGLSIPVAIAGAWKDATPQILIAGAWHDISAGKILIDGAWKDHP